MLLVNFDQFSLEYNHVAREILGGWNGTANSLPASISSGTTQSYTYTCTIPTVWNEANLEFIGLLIDQTTGKVLNANNEHFFFPTASFDPADGTTNVAIDTEIKITFSQEMRLVNNDAITNTNIHDFVDISKENKAI